MDSLEDVGDAVIWKEPAHLSSIHPDNSHKLANYRPSWDFLGNRRSSLVQNGLQDFGITQEFLDDNTHLYDIRGKVLKTNAFLSSETNAPMLDSLLDDSNGDMTSFEKAMKLHYGV